ncbi:efflux RND transporter periplasmic adaptor subunit [Patescibacteria group bacterium]|nr:efflux RND transporter periplasmic adaptor subunit [Patescibacteria group bacterium]
MKKDSLFKKIRRPLFFALIIGGVIFYFNRKSSITVQVRKIDVQDRKIQKTVSASGVVNSSDYADLSFSANGNIIRINVSENEKVTKGQLLAYIDPSVQSQTAQSYKDARDIRLRQKELFEKEKKANQRLLGGEKSYDIKLREYEEMVSQAEASYQAQLSLLSNYYIYAPFDGTVITTYKKVGEVATMGSPVLRVADLDSVIFEIIIDQEDYSNVFVGQEVEIDLDAYEDDVFKGSVQTIPLYFDPVDGGFKVKVKFESNGQVIKMGMTGDAYMIIESTESEVQSLIFNEISYDESDNPFVWTLEEGKVKKLPVELGLQGDIYSEIKTDLSGATVVVPARDGIDIKEGFTAKVIN